MPRTLAAPSAWGVVALLLGACVGEGDPPIQSVAEGPAVGSSSADGTSEGAQDDEGGDGDCGWVSDESVNGLAPVDVLFVVDNSGSMQFEEAAVQASMNDFSNTIVDADIDVRVLLLSNYHICVDPPLGSGGCPDQDSNAPDYVHLDMEVGSGNALALLSQSAEAFALFDPLLREGSLKHVVVVSDDNSYISATEFDETFRALGSKYEDYRFHAIVASQGPELAPCVDISAAKGEVYLELVELRDGIAGDLCGQDFSPVFEALAMTVTQNTPVACEWPVPDAPEGQSQDLDEVEVQLEIDGQGEILPKVAGPDACGSAEGWYFDPEPPVPASQQPVMVRVCPETCARVQAAMDAEVTIAFPCEPPPENQEAG